MGAGHPLRTAPDGPPPPPALDCIALFLCMMQLQQQMENARTKSAGTMETARTRNNVDCVNGMVGTRCPGVGMLSQSSRTTTRSVSFNTNEPQIPSLEVAFLPGHGCVRGRVNSTVIGKGSCDSPKGGKGGGGGGGVERGRGASHMIRRCGSSRTSLGTVPCSWLSLTSISSSSLSFPREPGSDPDSWLPRNLLRGEARTRQKGDGETYGSTLPNQSREIE